MKKIKANPRWRSETVNSSFRCVIHMTGFLCVVVNRIINSGVETTLVYHLPGLFCQAGDSNQA
jgi:RecJ-like exonuclease